MKNSSKQLSCKYKKGTGRQLCERVTIYCEDWYRVWDNEVKGKE